MAPCSIPSPSLPGLLMVFAFEFGFSGRQTIRVASVEIETFMHLAVNLLLTKRTKFEQHFEDNTHEMKSCKVYDRLAPRAHALP